MGRGGEGVSVPAPARPAARKGLLVGIQALAYGFVCNGFSQSPKLAELSGAAPKPDSPAAARPKAPSFARPGGLISAEEVASHSSPCDAWLTIKGKVYDISNFAAEHPGGKVLYTHAGRDATDVFSIFHHPASYGRLKEKWVGDAAPAPVPEAVEDFRRMRATMIAAHMFDSNKAYYAFKFLSTWAILAFTYWFTARFAAHSAAGFAASAALLALFWQQSGWLAHDFLHHQVFKDRYWNGFFGMIMGNFAQGFSIAWWKDKHNTHHAATNELTPEYSAIDPDIDTLPLIAWSPELLATVREPGQRALLRLQHVLFFPILLFARMQWALASVHYARDKGLKFEQFMLVCHYAWVAAVGLGGLPWYLLPPFFVLAQMFGGMFLAIIFVQSHNFMDVVIGEQDFVRAQIATTRNISSGLFNDWFSGGLNRQIEHHLFPTLPRHNLGRAAALVRSFCARHGIAYQTVGIPEGTLLILRRLAEVAKLA